MDRYVLILKGVVIGECWTSNPDMVPVDENISAVQHDTAQVGWTAKDEKLSPPKEA